MNTSKLNSNLFKQYQNQLIQMGVSESTIKRKLASLRKFSGWLAHEGYLKKDPLTISPRRSPFGHLRGIRLAPRVAFQAYRALPYFTYLNFLILLVFLTALGWGLYQQFVVRAPRELAYPAGEVGPKRYLSFQGRLTDSNYTPIVTAVNMEFKLYDEAGTGSPPSGGTLLWDTGATPCSVDPDQDGIFALLLGTTTGDGYTCSSATEIPSHVFSENAEVWLETKVASETLSPRIQIATVGYALNAETLQGFPLASAGSITPEATMGATARTVPAINPAGNLVIASDSPTIWSTSGTFGIKGQAITIQTDTGTGGNITLAPDGIGVINIVPTSGNQIGGTVNATNSALTTGALYTGRVQNDNTGFDFLRFFSGTSPVKRFSVGALGNIDMENNLDVGGAATITGTLAANGAIISNLVPSGTRNLGSSGSNWDYLYVNNLDAFTLQGAVTGNNQTITGLEQLTVNNLRLDGNTLDSTSGNLTLLSAGELYFDDTRTGTIPFSLADTALNANLGQAIIDAINDAYEAATGMGGVSGFWTKTSGLLFPNNAYESVAIGGTATSSAKLYFEGTTGNASMSGQLTLHAAGTNYINALSGQALSLRTSVGGDAGLTDRLYITNAGNVGIGTTDPAYGKLEVDGAGGYQYGISLYSGAGGSMASSYLKTDGGSDYNWHLTRGGNDTKGIVIDKDGEVGIGTSSPGSLLSLGGSLANTKLALYDGGSAFYGMGIQANDFRFHVWSSAADFNFYDAPAGNALMTIKGTGNVGIGTTGPGGKLEIVGGGAGVKSLLVRGNSSNDANIQEWQNYAGTALTTINNNGQLTIGANYTSTITTGSDSMASVVMYATPPSASDADYRGIQGQSLLFSGAAANTTGQISGVIGIGKNTTSYTAGNVSGLYSQVYNTSTGTITNAFGLQLTPYNSNASGTITNLYGAKIQNLTNAGTIANTYGFYVGDITTGTQTNTPFSFYASDANAFNYFAGNVGIGTTTPLGALHIDKNTSVNPALIVNQLGSGNIIEASSSGTRKFFVTNDGSINSSGYATVSGSLALGYSSVLAGTGNAAFAGSVGIGTTAPGAPLEVAGNNPYIWVKDTSHSGNSAIAYIEGKDSASSSLWAFGDAWDGNGDVYFANTQTGGKFYIRTENINRMTVDNNGNVGIGTTNPSQKLDVAGNATISGTLALAPQTLAYAGTCNAAAEGKMYYDNAANKYYYCDGSTWTEMGAGAAELWEAGTYGTFEDDAAVIVGADAAFSWADGGVGDLKVADQLEVAGDASISGTLTIGQGETIRPAYGPLQFAYKSGADAWTTGMVMTESGYVGIGTTNPLVKLQVTGGNLAIHNGYPSALLLGGTDDNSNAIEASTYTVLTINKAGWPNVYVRGSVGIGTSSPASTLHLTSSQAGKTTLGDSRQLILEDTYWGIGERLEIGMGYKTGVTYQPVVLGYILTANSGNTKGDFYIATRGVETDTAPTERLYIQAGGYVGIGTTTPSEKLDVAGNASVSGNLTLYGGARTIAGTQMNTLTLGDANTGNIQFYSSSNTLTSSGHLNLAGNVGIGGTAIDPNVRLGIHTTSGTEILFDTNYEANITAVNHMYIKAGTAKSLYFGSNNVDAQMALNAGNVGIGTTAPTAELDVSGTASVSALTIRGTSPGYINQLNGNDLQFRTSAGGDTGLTTKMTLSNAGNVGIGTTNPSQKLEVASGNILLSDTSNGSLKLSYGGQLFDESSRTLIEANNDRFDVITENGSGHMFEVSSTSYNFYMSNVVKVNMDSSGNLAIEGALSDLSDSTLSINDNLSVVGNVLPSTGSTYDLGSSSLPWNNAYANNLFGSSSGTQGFWTKTSGVLYPNNTYESIAVGGTSTTSAKLLFSGPTGNASMSGILTLFGATPAITTTNRRSLTLGDASTGNIVIYNDLQINGSEILDSNGIARISLGSTTEIIANLSVTQNLTVDTDTFFVDASTNRVGIGTTDPQAKLDIAGASSLISNSSGDITLDASSGYISFSSDYISNLGGIYGDLNVTGNILNSTAERPVKISDWTLIQTSTPSAALMVDQTGVGDIFTASTSGVAKFTIKNNGNVGIGTTSPGAKLDISNTGGAANLKVIGSGGNFEHTITDEYDINYTRTSSTAVLDFRAIPADGTSQGQYRFGLSSGSTGSNSIFLFQPNSTTIQTKISTSGESTYFNTQGGNVGIGTTSPTAPLHIVGGSLDGTPNVAGLQIAGDSMEITSNGSTPFIDFQNDISGTDYDARIRLTGDDYLAIEGANVGIGTASPGYPLVVERGSSGIVSTFATTSSNSSSRVRIIGNGGDTYSYGVLEFARSDSGAYWAQQWRKYTDYPNDLSFDYYNGSTWTHGINILDTGGHADIAESIHSIEPTEKGDLLSITNPQGESTVKITDTEYDNNLIGAVSTRPGLAIGNGVSAGAPDHNPNKPLISLAGRVSVKVTSINGFIDLGERITSSPLKGYGMKATKVGKIVGSTLEKFEPNDAKCPVVLSLQDIIWPDDQGENEQKPCFKLPDGTYVGKIMVFVNLGWYDPSAFITDAGELGGIEEINTNEYQLTDKAGGVIDRFVYAGEALIAELKAGLIQTQELFAEKKIVSPLVETDQLTADSIQSTESKFGKLLVENEQGETVASIDSAGNASFGGLLASEELLVSEDATIAGTLYAQEIVTEKGTFGDLLARVENLENSESQNTQSVSEPESQSAGESESLISSDFSETPSSSESSDLAEASESWPISDPSDDVQITDSLTVLGTSSLAETSVMGQLMVDATIIIDKDGIQTLPGSNLKLQAYGWGGIDMLDGKVVIDTSGNVLITGELTAKKINTGGLVLSESLSQDEETTSSGFGKLLAVINKEGVEVASIDASGSAFFASLGIEADYSATQSGAIIAAFDNYYENGYLAPAIKTNATAGIGILPAYEEEVMIYNPQVTGESLIYVTATTNTENKVLYVKAKHANTRECQANESECANDGWFIVALNESLTKDIQFNWWIIGGKPPYANESEQ